MGPWSYANLSPGRYTDPDGREAADCVRMGMEWGSPEWNANPLCRQLSNGQAMTLARAAYKADQAGFTDPSADRAFNEHMAFKRWHSKYIGRPLFAASAAMAGAFSATACALNPACQAAAAKSAGPVLTYGLFSSGAGTWQAGMSWAGSCWTSATGGGAQADAADAECWFGVGTISPAAKPAWNAAQALRTKAISAISPNIEIAGALDGMAAAEARAVRWSSSGASWKSKADPTGWAGFYEEELGLDELAGMGVELEAGTGMSVSPSYQHQISGPRPPRRSGPVRWPWGAQNRTMAKRIDQLLEGRGPDWELVNGGPFKERVIDTPGGLKPQRRPDITLRNKRTGEYYDENIVKTDAKGNPTPYEQGALDDLRSHGFDIQWHPIDPSLDY
jgi:hypothetical protein